MSDRAKARIGVVVIVALLGVLAATQPGCGTIAGVGRDITAWAEGGAIDAGDNARKIRGK